MCSIFMNVAARIYRVSWGGWNQCEASRTTYQQYWGRRQVWTGEIRIPRARRMVKGPQPVCVVVIATAYLKRVVALSLSVFLAPSSTFLLQWQYTVKSDFYVGPDPQSITQKSI